MLLVNLGNSCLGSLERALPRRDPLHRRITRPAGALTRRILNKARRGDLPVPYWWAYRIPSEGGSLHAISEFFRARIMVVKRLRITTLSGVFS
jgi:hypothetical protein